LESAKAVIRTFIANCRSEGVTIDALSIKKSRWGIQNQGFWETLWSEKGPRKSAQQRQWIQFAEAIRADPQSVIRELTGSGLIAAKRDDAEWLIQEALRAKAETETADAVPLARRAFLLAWRHNPESGLRMLPRTLYVIHRYGAVAEMVLTVRRWVMPALAESRKPFPTRQNESRAASLALLACMFNEGGRGDEAEELFQRVDVAALKHGSEHYPWLPTMLIRNEAHYWAWHERLGGRAKDRAEEAAEREPSTGKMISVINTRCETLMAVGQVLAAWEEIESEYFRVRKLLEMQYSVKQRDFTGSLPPRLHHTYAAFVFGILARCRVPAAYPAEELEHDLSLAEAFLLTNADGKPERPIRIGHRPTVEVAHPHPNLTSRLRQLVKASRRETISDAQLEALNEFAKQLIGL
jgi:hypothetical protein